MWLAAHAPERINRLALLCTAAHLPPASGWQQRAATVRSAGMGAVAEAVVARLFTPGFRADVVASFAAAFFAIDPEGYAGCCEAIAGMDLRPLQDRFDGGLTVTTGDTVGAQQLLTQLGPVPVLSALLDRLEPDGVGEGPTAVGVAASVLEFALEGLYLNRRLAKDSDGTRTVYGA